MSIKLHRCRFTFLRSDRFECHRVQQALDDQGIDYELVKEPYFPRSRRKNVERLTGQRLLPVIEFEDGFGVPRGVRGHGRHDPERPARCEATPPLSLAGLLRDLHRALGSVQPGFPVTGQDGAGVRAGEHAE